MPMHLAPDGRRGLLPAGKPENPVREILFAVRTPKGRPYRCSCPKSTEFLLGETI